MGYTHYYFRSTIPNAGTVITCLSGYELNGPIERLEINSPDFSALWRGGLTDAPHADSIRDKFGFTITSTVSIDIASDSRFQDRLAALARLLSILVTYQNDHCHMLTTDNAVVLFVTTPDIHRECDSSEDDILPYLTIARREMQSLANPVIL